MQTTFNVGGWQCSAQATHIHTQHLLRHTAIKCVGGSVLLLREVRELFLAAVWWLRGERGEGCG
ncbi:hypothetical protein GBAR_LOCUS21224, partial [Geodia barretti]